MSVRDVVSLYHQAGPVEIAWRGIEFLRMVGAGSMLVIAAALSAAFFLAATL